VTFKVIHFADQLINQSKFVFRVITENYNVINAVAVGRLPEKHYALLKTGRLKKQNNINTSTSEKERGRRKN